MVDGSDTPGARPTFRVITGTPARVRADDLLVRNFLEGDEDAFGELVRKHERTVLAVLRRYADGAEDDAHDLAQRAFLRAFEATRRSSWLRVRGPLPFRAWLIRIAVNLGKNHLRDARRWRRAPESAAEEVAVPPVGSASIERRQREEAVRAAVLELPRRQREVLTLRIDAELPFRDIADVLGITENNAKVHFHHAARKLRELVVGKGTP
jgi:RNA polymerase sigma-70 factor (ECF subfamily)